MIGTTFDIAMFLSRGGDFVQGSVRCPPRIVRPSVGRAGVLNAYGSAAAQPDARVHGDGDAELCLPYRVAQVCNADARDHSRVAKNDWRAGQAVKESNSGAKKNRRDVNG